MTYYKSSCVGLDVTGELAMWNAGWNEISDNCNYTSFPISSPLSQLSTYSMDSGYTGHSGSSPPQQQATASSSHIMQAFSDYNADHDSFPECIPENVFYGSQTASTGDYPIFLTPSTTTVATMNPNNLTTPHLEIVEQPTDKPFRFRYKSEMHGTHGSLMGIKTERAKRTYPTVTLRNFNFAAKAMIRCSLYQVLSESGNAKRSPHSHKLVIRRGDVEESDPHDIEVSSQNDFTAVFQGMGIIHTAKRHIKEELCKKIRAEREFDENRQLSTAELTAIHRDAEKQAKEMNLNQVCLCFQAYVRHEADNSWVKICDPIYSKTVNNMKSALTGELRITRMSTYTSLVTGGQEVFMFVEKVCKNNIKVRFFELDENGSTIWEDFGVFNEADVHHQYGIVLKTPPYKKSLITSPVTVLVQLFRPSDGSSSESLEFRYKPSIQAGVKRSRTDSSEFLPTVIGSHESSSQDRAFPGSLQQAQNTSQSFANKFSQSGHNQAYDLEESLFTNDILSSYIGTFTAAELNISSNDLKGLWQCNPEEFFHLLDIEFAGASKLEIDGAGGKQMESHCATSTINCSLFDKLKMLIKLFKDNFEDEKLHDMMMVLIEAQAETGENLLLDCIEHGTVDEIKHLVLILVKYKLMDVLKSVNDLDQNCFHLLILAGHKNLLKIFLNLGVDVNQADAFGQTPLHLAALQNDQDFVNELLDGTTGIKLNELNDDGFSPLHLAVMNNRLPTVKSLIEAGANVQKRNPKSGDNVLHMAVSAEQVNMPLITCLIECDEQLLFQENNARQNVFQLASNGNQVESLLLFLSGFYDESYTKSKPSCEDDSSSESDNEYNESSADFLFDEQCLQALCRIFDKNEKWKDVMIIMGLEDVIEEWETHESPSRKLFKHLEKTKKSLQNIIEVFDLLDEHQAIDLITEMVVRKLDK